MLAILRFEHGLPSMKWLSYADLCAGVDRLFRRTGHVPTMGHKWNQVRFGQMLTKRRLAERGLALFNVCRQGTNTTH